MLYHTLNGRVQRQINNPNDRAEKDTFIDDAMAHLGLGDTSAMVYEQSPRDNNLPLI